MPQAATCALAVLGAIGVAYCVSRLGGSPTHAGDYVLRGYGANSYTGVFIIHRRHHGSGTVLALIACGLIALTMAGTSIRRG